MRGLGSSIYPATSTIRRSTKSTGSPRRGRPGRPGRWLPPTTPAAGGASGAVALVAGWAARTYPAQSTIAAIFPDGPQRYFDTVFQRRLLPSPSPARRPTPRTAPQTISDPAQTVVDSWTRCTGAQPRRGAELMGTLAEFRSFGWPVGC